MFLISCCFANLSLSIIFVYFTFIIRPFLDFDEVHWSVSIITSLRFTGKTVITISKVKYSPSISYLLLSPSYDFPHTVSKQDMMTLYHIAYHFSGGFWLLPCCLFLNISSYIFMFGPSTMCLLSACMTTEVVTEANAFHNINKCSQFL